MSIKVPLGEIFGVQNKRVKSYLKRKEVDTRFEESLKEEKHIIIYGSSKQGKTSLIREHLKAEEKLQINCDKNAQVDDIYKAILRKVGISLQVVEEKSTGIEGGGSSKFNFKAIIPILGGAENESEVTINKSKEKKIQTQSIPINLSIANDICDALEEIKFKKFIILENFHYLSDCVQKQLSYDLRTFHDRGICFIIIGIWREKNKLLKNNGELSDRVIEIPVEPWKIEDFEKIVKNGSDLLNIEFDCNIKRQIIEISFGNVGLLQELCKKYCVESGIVETVNIKKRLDNQEALERAISEKVEEYSSRHIRALDAIANIGSYKEGLFMKYYLIKVLVNSSVSNLVNGLSRVEITSQISKIHHKEDIRDGDITYLLNNIAKTQADANISPPLFDYDINNRSLKIIDSTLLFYLNFKDGKDIMFDIVDPRIGKINLD
ncbi:hypothetical protein POG14_00890 [Clostridium paraputrificum]|uniref:hypothetical protein n=1 Tax=Clostridium paraputrificum TaxID=29363 RepID=UPI001899DD13|nr:hypothetical protein [Clostridium paraputrificum]MDC0800723.1 hypothetical protein [Clostridium paraputrificum]